MSVDAPRFAKRRRALIPLLVVAGAAGILARLSAQSLSVRAEGDALHIRVPALGLIEGTVLARLKDGRALRVQFELGVQAVPDGPAVAQATHAFNVSYDLWEERIAVSRMGTPPRSTTHLSAAAAEAWLVENVTVPLAALAGLGRDAPFWIRLAYRVEDPTPTSEPETSGPFTLRGLIDRLSRRPKDADPGRTLSAGPFRLPR